MDLERDGNPLLLHFDLSNGGFPFRKDIPTIIEDRRGLLNGLLIFDILLQSGGIRDAHLLYPPRDPESLSLLLDAITNSTYDSLKKDCLVYFLIKWHEFKIDGSGGDRIREEMFVQERCIPPQFVLLADAYWYFDTGSDVERGVSILSDRRLNKDYASKIMQTIALSQNPAPLIVKYIRTARPLLTEPPDLNLYTEALLAGSSNGVLDAWLFQRTFPDCNEMKARLVRIIIDWCLTPKPKADALKTLLSLPFTPSEQATVEEFAVSPPSELSPKSLAVLQDLLVLRLVQAGRYTEAVKLDRRYPPSTITSEVGRRTAEKRRQMLDEVLAVMPSVERQMLDMELEHEGNSLNGKNDLSASWQHVAISSIPRRSHAPRFGGRVSFGRPGDFPYNPGPRAMVPVAFSTETVPSPSHGTSVSQIAVPESDPALATSPIPPARVDARAGTPGAHGRSGKKPAAAKAFLYETVGSANTAPNAFYAGSQSKKPVEPLDVAMDAQDEPNASQPADADLDEPMADSTPRATRTAVAALEVEDRDEVPSFSHSLFSPRAEDEEAPPVISSRSTAPAANAVAPPLARTESEQMQPPGAFFSTPPLLSQMLPADLGPIAEDEEVVVADAEATSSKRPRRSTAAKTPKTPAKGKSKSKRKSTIDLDNLDLSRSIPGALEDDGLYGITDEEEEKAPDNVGPLPRATRSVRKARSGASATTSVASDDGKEESGPSVARRSTRRSSRVSVVHEDQSSPERTTRRSTRSTAAKAEGRNRATKKRA